jgi:hypothetical protein
MLYSINNIIVQNSVLHDHIHDFCPSLMIFVPFDRIPKS